MSLDESNASKRTRASGEVLDYLIKQFNANHNPSPEQRREISDKTNMNEKAVRIWFQNRRAKLRKFEKLLKLEHSSRSNSITGSYTGSGIPIDINEFYGFIDCSSLSVGSWQRIKSGSHDSNHLISNLLKLSPMNLQSIMTNVDLLVVLSKKNYEINYFFSAIANNNKILFRIFYPINSIITSSLLDNNIIKQSSELRISLKSPPKFSVYFGNHANNQWSLCEDFSEGQQVSQACVTEKNSSCTPHVLVGVKNSLQFLHSYITENIRLDLDSYQQPFPQNLTPPDSDLGLPKYKHQSQINLHDNHGSQGNFQFLPNENGSRAHTPLDERSLNLDRSTTPLDMASHRSHTPTTRQLDLMDHFPENTNQTDTPHSIHSNGYHNYMRNINMEHSLLHNQHPTHSISENNMIKSNILESFMFNHPNTPEFLSSLSNDMDHSHKSDDLKSQSPSSKENAQESNGTYTHIHQQTEIQDLPISTDDFLIDAQEFDFDLDQEHNFESKPDFKQNSNNSNMDSFIDFGSNYQ